jgi:hypothetical protein
MQAIASDPDRIASAANMFVEARRAGRLLDGAPAYAKTATVHEAQAIQESTAAARGATIRGCEVAAPIDGQIVRGATAERAMFVHGLKR